MSNIPGILTPKEAARLLKVGEKHVQKLVKQGVIPAQKVGNTWAIKVKDVVTYRSGA